MADDVTIKDGGFKKAIDRLYALEGATVSAGVYGSRDVKRYGAVHQARMGWKSKADEEINAQLEGRLEATHKAVLEGRGDIEGPIDELGEFAVNELRKQIDAHDLIDTGALRASIAKKVKVR